MSTITTATEDVPAGDYSLDPVHSTFGFAVKHNEVSTFRGEFEQVVAKLQNGVLTGIAQVESVNTPSAELKSQLVAPEFFSADQTPTITFRSTDIRIADGGEAEVDGELTIRGVTHPVTAKGSVAVGQNLAGAEVVGLDLEARIDRREYGLNWQAQLPSGGDVLAWDVVLEAHLELVKA
jgi:polyisoprenoid-binding protein YceI